MNIYNSGRRVHVTLSQRNLRDLMRAVERGTYSALRRTCEDGTTLTVEVEAERWGWDAAKRGIGRGIDANHPVGKCGARCKGAHDV